MANPFYDRARAILLKMRDELRALPTDNRIAAEGWVYKFCKELVR
jgi:hypothetical protein